MVSMGYPNGSQLWDKDNRSNKREGEVLFLTVDMLIVKHTSASTTNLQKQPHFCKQLKKIPHSITTSLILQHPLFQ
jgi:hypothetical protein